jgi:hypothetical protein
VLALLVPVLQRPRQMHDPHLGLAVERHPRPLAVGSVRKARRW